MLSVISALLLFLLRDSNWVISESPAAVTDGGDFDACDPDGDGVFGSFCKSKDKLLCFGESSFLSDSGIFKSPNANVWLRILEGDAEYVGLPNKSIYWRIINLLFE